MKKFLIVLIISLFFGLLLPLVIWMHHTFVSGLNPFLGLVFIILMVLIAIPLLIRFFYWAKKKLFNNVELTPALLFAMGFLSLCISDLVSYVFIGNSTLDIHLHDTLFVIAHFHAIVFILIFFLIFFCIYYWFARIFKRRLNDILGYIHFWIIFIGTYLIFSPLDYEGLAGMPRRYTDYSGWYSFNQFELYNRYVSITAILILVAQLIFLFNFFYSIFKGRKVIE